MNNLELIKEIEPKIYHYKKPTKHRMGIFKCHCGKKFKARFNSVNTGNTTSCGCNHKKWMKDYFVKHGKRKHPLYMTWHNMVQRCYKEDLPRYKDWGGRGIIVCDNWKNDFEVFYNWAIDNGWEQGLQIDRTNNDGNYEPSNCRFVTPKENCQNRRTKLKVS